MRKLGAELAKQWRAGDIVLLKGELGAGKTTFVRGVVESLGVADPVKSPTFNLIQLFETRPPVMHADLYRLKSADGVGIEEYFEDHLSLIEWPDRLGDPTPDEAWTIAIEFEGDGRRVQISAPS